MKKLFIYIISTLLVTACGWHLRGSTNTSSELKDVYVSAIDAHGELVTEMRHLLTVNRIKTLDDNTLAKIGLYILDERKDRRTAGVDSNALSSAYEITLKVAYEIRMADSAKVAKGTATSVRSFNYNTQSINSAAQEENLLQTEMRRDLAQQMLRRLNAVAAKDTNESGSNGKTAP